MNEQVVHVAECENIPTFRTSPLILGRLRRSKKIKYSALQIQLHGTDYNSEHFCVNKTQMDGLPVERS